MFPARTGVSSVVSPHTIVTGLAANFSTHCKLEFGTYAQTHEQHTNDVQLRLPTGKRLHRFHRTALLMPAEVFNQVHNLACHQPSQLLLADVRGAPIAPLLPAGLTHTRTDDHDSNNADDDNYVPDIDEHDNDSNHNIDDDDNDERKEDDNHDKMMRAMMTMMMRAVLTTISTRAKRPNNDDYKKLCQVIKYLDSTKELVLRLSAD